MSFLMAGTVSTNPVLFFAGILLILAWKNAGYLGIDRFLLPALGTPWKQPMTAPAAPATVVHQAA
jgi:thiosulfate dehydrogenase [quinone] large subunit